jgi:acetoin utilization deacetylase AcuC-like enzyme
LKAFYTDHFVLPLPAGHRFPMEKYSRLRDLVSKEDSIELIEAPAASDTQILYAHDPLYLIKIMATVAACKSALSEGIAVNLAGGTHHAYRDTGSGFCVFNDSAIAARTLQKEVNSKLKIAIIDLDVHQGNGTASILEHDASIFTLSMHGENNFPFKKETSDLDLGLPDGCDDSRYLKELANCLDQLESRFTADCIIYLAGADPHEGDRLGRLNISKEGMRIRDELVYEFAQTRNLPVAISMAGGYGKEIDSTVDIHFQTIMTALLFQKTD